MLIDSNILVYAINNDSPKQASAREFLLAYQHRGLAVAHQNIFETLRVLTHPKFPHPMSTVGALREIDGIVRGLHIVTPDYKTHIVALELIKKHNLTSDQVFDAYLAATALTAGIEIIATENIKDFAAFPLKTHNPFAVTHKKPIN